MSYTLPLIASRASSIFSDNVVLNSSISCTTDSLLAPGESNSVIVVLRLATNLSIFSITYMMPVVGRKRVKDIQG